METKSYPIPHQQIEPFPQIFSRDSHLEPRPSDSSRSCSRDDSSESISESISDESVSVDDIDLSLQSENNGIELNILKGQTENKSITLNIQEVKVNDIDLEIGKNIDERNSSFNTSRESTCIDKVKNVFGQEKDERALIKNMLSEEQQQKVETKSLLIVRKWVYAVLTTFVIGHTFSLINRENKAKPIPKAINWFLTAIILVLTIYSKVKNLRAMYAAVVICQIRILVSIFRRENIFESDQFQLISVQTLVLLVASIMNQILLSQLFISNKHLINFFSIALSIIGVLQRFYGFDYLTQNIMMFILPTLELIIMGVLFIYFNQSLQNLNLDILIEANKSLMEMKVVKRLQQEFQEMFESLQEGIVVIQNEAIIFKNSIFTQVCGRGDENLPFMDLHIFKLFRQNEDEEKPNVMEMDFGKVFSLRQLISLDQEYLDDKIFELIEQQIQGMPQAEGGELKSQYKYVYLKINKIHQYNQSHAQKLLIQIIDISDKMLYNEIKAEKQFLTLINAAISHELRNPLNSLIGQMNSMQNFFDSFSKILDHCKKEEKMDREILNILVKIYDGMYSCGSKIFSATKFIDFFVHDILDYTILNKQQKNFTKNSILIDIREAIQEIIDIQHDKIALKTIQISTNFKNFENFLVKTDIKRFQQVFLNLIANSLKFTDRFGKIIVNVEQCPNDFIKLSVIDNGIGIKKKDQDKLFKMFGSIKDEKKQLNTNGIGLGLVISKLIVNKFNGNIDFYSKYRKGSTFFYTFEIEPHNQEQSLKICQDRDRPDVQLDLSELLILEEGIVNQFKILKDKNNNDFSQKVFKTSLTHAWDTFSLFNQYRDNRILVIDDEEFCLSSMRAILFSLGINVDYQVEFCITGKEAFEQIQRTYQSGMKYKLIFTDFSMPVMNGITATVKIRKYLANELKIKREDQPRIIGVTGHVMESFKQEGKQAGMDEIFGKPLYVETMREILNKHYQK